MSIKIKILILSVIAILMHSAISYASEDYNGYIVRLRDGFTPEQISSSVSLMSLSEENNTSIKEIYKEENLYRIPDEETLEYYMSIDAIEHYEPDYYAELFYTPDDTYYNETYQKYLWNINVQSAWDLGCYGNEVKIAVIDSGISDHNDLRGAFAGGENFVSAELEEDAVNSENYYDTLGHGTFVAGVIGAQFNNYRIAGIAPKVKLYSLKCTSTGSNIQYSDIIDCIYSAVNDFDCDIINMSLGGAQYSWDMYLACLYARNKGAIICAAAGNYAQNGNPVMYPAAYGCVIGVGAVDYNNEHCGYSEYNESVHVCAPGGNNVNGQWMWGLNINNGFTGRCGTSFACPVVTAAAAIAKNIKPDITHDEFAKVLELTSTDLGDEGYDIYYGYGLLNIDAITKYLLKDKDIFLSPITEWNDSRTDMTFLNNTDETIDFFALWKNDSFSDFEISSANAKSAKEITLSGDYETVKGYIIDKYSLKPLIGK